MNRKIRIALDTVQSNGLGGIFWGLGMLASLIRANLKRLALLKRPILIFLESGAVLAGWDNLKVGALSYFGRQCRVTAWNGGYVNIGREFKLGEFSILENGFSISSKKGCIQIGSNVGIGAFSFISCPSNISIGDDCIIGQYFSAHAQNHIFDKEGLIRHQGTSELGILIESNCWIGSKVTILDGVTVGAGSVIAAGAVVISSFPPKSLIAGCPARLIRSI